MYVVYTIFNYPTVQINKKLTSSQRNFKKILTSTIEKPTWHKCISYVRNVIGHYNPSIRIIDLASQTTYVVCVNFIHKWRDLQFNVDSEQQIFLRNFSWQFLFTFRVFARNLLRWHSLKEYFFIFYFDGLEPGFTSNKPTHYPLDYGD